MEKRKRYKNIVLLLMCLFVLLLLGCGSQKNKNDLPADDIYSLLYCSRDHVHRELGIDKDDFTYQFSQEEDPLRQYEMLNHKKNVESKSCQIRLHFNAADQLDIVDCIFSVTDMSYIENWKWAVKITEHLDAKWKDAGRSLGDVFKLKDDPSFEKSFVKTRRWEINDNEKYSFSWGFDPEVGSIVVSFSGQVDK